MKKRLYYDPIFLEHNTGEHPERRERVSKTIAAIKNAEFANQLEFCSPPAANIEEINLIHDLNCIHKAQAASEQESYLDPDTPTSKQSFLAACQAAGAAIDAAKAVYAGEAKNAFCLVRPPGHHARPGSSMGFCIFNNVAIAAQYLKKHLGLQRIAIIDWDVHHGNGTQEAFYEDPGVLFFSIHRYPFYPGAGSVGERGKDAGLGFTINKPMPADTSNGEFIAEFRFVIEGPIAEYKPQMIFISAGFDGHKADPIGGIGLETEDFFTLTEIVKSVANKSCDGKIVSLLEGGYNLEVLPASICAHLRSLTRR